MIMHVCKKAIKNSTYNVLFYLIFPKIDWSKSTSSSDDISVRLIVTLALSVFVIKIAVVYVAMALYRR